MSQRIPRPEEEIFSLPDFHDDDDLFDDDPSSSAQPSRRRIFILLSIILLVVLLAGVGFVVNRNIHIVYQAKRIAQGDLVLTVAASGSLHTNIYTVNFMGTGKLAEVNVSIGQQVKKDQILAKLDSTSLQDALNEAQANLNAAQTALDNANANYEAIQSVSQFSSTQPTYRPAIIWPGYQSSSVQPASTSSRSNGSSYSAKANVSALSTTTAQAPVVSTPQSSTSGGTNKVQVTEALGQIKAAQKALELAQTKVTTAQYNLNNVILKAPHDGMIAALNGVVGGEPATNFIQIVDISSLQLQVNVNEDKIGAISVGDPVNFAVDAYPGQSFAGSVATILPLSQSNATNVTYPVLITLTSAIPSSAHLFPGMMAHAIITTDERTGVALIPGSALAFARAQAKAGNQSPVSHAQMQAALTRAKEMVQNLQQNASQDTPTAAVVLESDAYDKIRVVPIVVGLTNGAEYEVLDGLSANDVVLVGMRTSNN